MMNQTRVACLLLCLCLTGLTAAAESEPQPLYRVEGRPPAPLFSLLDTNGNKHNLADYRGKVVVINFWATWCPPCRYELPSMEIAYQKLQPHGIEILALNVGEDSDTIFTFTADFPVSFPLVMDRDSSVIQAYPVIGLPTTFVIGPDGHLEYRAIGSRVWDNKNLLQQILELKTPSP